MCPLRSQYHILHCIVRILYVYLSAVYCIVVGLSSVITIQSIQTHFQIVQRVSHPQIVCAHSIQCMAWVAYMAPCIGGLSGVITKAHLFKPFPNLNWPAGPIWGGLFRPIG